MSISGIYFLLWCWFFLLFVVIVAKSLRNWQYELSKIQTQLLYFSEALLSRTFIASVILISFSLSISFSHLLIYYFCMFNSLQSVLSTYSSYLPQNPTLLFKLFCFPVPVYKKFSNFLLPFLFLNLILLLGIFDYELILSCEAFSKNIFCFLMSLHQLFPP